MQLNRCLPIRPWVPVALALFAGLPASPAVAQTSREQEIAQQQAEKAKITEPYQPGWVEKKVLAFEDRGALGIWKGFLITFGDIKTGSGVAAGPMYARYFGDGALFTAKGVYSVKSFKVGQVFLQSAPLASGKLLINGRARWQDAPTLPIYNLGIGSSRDHANYSETKTEVSGQALFRPVWFLRFAGGAGYERFETSPTDAARVLFQPAPLPGLGADPDYLHSFGSAAIDTTKGISFSRSGVILGGTLHDYRQQNDGPYSFRQTNSIARVIIPILHGNWAIDLSARATTSTADDGNAVPFFLMPTLGGGDALRGFANYRFRDLNSLVLTGEYRWYVQEFVEMAIFYDAGKVAARRSDLDLDHLKSDVGIGLRIHTPQATALRIEVARSNEATRIIFAFSAAIK